MRFLSALSVLVAIVMLAGVALARPHRVRRHAHARVRTVSTPVDPASPSISVGRTNRGHLLHGVQLTESSTLHYKRGDGPTQHWGTSELVKMLRDAAEHVATVLPGASLDVGDLSRRRGGWFPPHRSHRSGRDVDIGFYVTDAQGHSVLLDHFVRFNIHGRAFGGDDYHFDAARNWELIASLLDDSTAPVQYIFVCRRIRRWLLAEGERRHASEAVLERAATVLYQPRRGGAHRSHFHVRIYCDPSDRPRCVDVTPFWGLYPYAHYPTSAPLTPLPAWARATLARLTPDGPRAR